jgi:hypothetical protein
MQVYKNVSFAAWPLVSCCVWFKVIFSLSLQIGKCLRLMFCGARAVAENLHPLCCMSYINVLWNPVQKHVPSLRLLQKCGEFCKQEYFYYKMGFRTHSSTAINKHSLNISCYIIICIFCLETGDIKGHVKNFLHVIRGIY